MAERLAELTELAEKVRDNTACPSSYAAYVNSYSRFISWFLINHSQLISPAFANHLESVEGLSEKQLRVRIKPLLTMKINDPPLLFDDFGLYR
ncbi:hypothetical protein PHMEG_00021467 [Phytophthora megakarya]|uniref:Uncharacterized protein n=1 Tax=Phytophthora megakarya TaxID=4795 RepID=A0A225VNG0_9STRA|nr:hypothetical protein PHMEG_00021467 [Phytophthora megakarya]